METQTSSLFPIGKLPIRTLEPIGEVTDKKQGVTLSRTNGTCDLPIYEQDEVTKI